MFVALHNTAETTMTKLKAMPYGKPLWAGPQWPKLTQAEILNKVKQAAERAGWELTKPKIATISNQTVCYWHMAHPQAGSKAGGQPYTLGFCSGHDRKLNPAFFVGVEDKPAGLFFIPTRISLPKITAEGFDKDLDRFYKKMTVERIVATVNKPRVKLMAAKCTTGDGLLLAIECMRAKGKPFKASGYKDFEYNWLQLSEPTLYKLLASLQFGTMAGPTIKQMDHAYECFQIVAKYYKNKLKNAA